MASLRGPGLHRWTSLLAGVGAAVLLGAVALLAVGWAAGWRSHAMTTPSMGRFAPVGTLVVSRPVAAGDVHVGEMIVFHPPGRPHTTYAHRAVAVLHGTSGTLIETKGDINASRDPWVLRPSDLIGRVVTRVPDAGFAVEMLPWLLLGLFVILLLTSGVRRSSRLSLRIGLLALLVAGLTYHFRPLERIVLLSQTVAGGRGTAIVVPTGVLPLRVHTPGGGAVNLSPGQVGVVRIAHVHADGVFRILSAAHLTGWWWVLLLLWLVPVGVSLAVRRDPLAHAGV